MKFERLMNSAFYRFMEKVYQLIMLNIFFILTTLLGLIVFTIGPAMVSLTLCIKSIGDKESIPLFKSYFKTFLKVYKKSVLYSIFFQITTILLIFWVCYFFFLLQENDSVIIGVLYYLSLIFSIINIFAFINSSFIFVYFPYLTKKKIIKYSYELMKLFILKLVILFGALIAFIYLGNLFPYAIPFILVSLYYYLFNYLIKDDYNRIRLKSEKSMSIYD